VTAAGRAAIEGAARGHAELVRRLVFDVLGADDLRSLETVVDKLSPLG